MIPGRTPAPSGQEHGAFKLNAGMAPPTAKEVRALFNRKAGSWPSKYAPKGKLNARLRQFTLRLGQLSPPPGRVLDLGCGTGEMAAAFGRMGYQVTACDIAEAMVDMARRTHPGPTVVWACLDPDWRVLPYEDGGFDAIVASSVFEYLTDVQHAATELSRVLRPGGILLLTVPNPFSRVRRLEGWLRKMLSHRRFLSLLSKVRCLDSYAAYLLLSRNRFGQDGWRSVLSSAHFAALEERDFSKDAWRRRAKAPLLLLAVRRVGAGPQRPA